MFRFCCKQHLDMYRMQSHDAEECNRCRERGIVARENGFYSFPFSWYPKDTLFQSSCAFYKNLGIHGKSPYMTDCECLSLHHAYDHVPIFKKGFASQSLTTESLKEQLSSWWGQKGNALFLGCQPLQDIEEVYDWKTYFEHKEKAVDASQNVDTKLALLCHIPLTIFWCVKRFLRNCEFSNTPTPKELKIIIAGPEKEYTQWPVLLELFNLLDGFDFDIMMIGPNLPTSANEKTVSIVAATGKTMKLSFKVAELVDRHSVLLMNYDIVCALNAGLGAYPRWMETISNTKLFMGMKRNLRMFFFTDYVDESIEVARKNLYMLFGEKCIPEYKGGFRFLEHQDIQHVPNWRICADYVENHVRISKSLMNPFRKPLTCIENSAHLLPYAPNGFGCFIEVRE